MPRRGRSKVLQSLWIASSLALLATTGYAKVSLKRGSKKAPFLEGGLGDFKIFVYS